MEGKIYKPLLIIMLPADKDTRGKKKKRREKKIQIPLLRNDVVRKKTVAEHLNFCFHSARKILSKSPLVFDFLIR